MPVHPLARALRDHLRTPGMWALLDPYDCGWLDGGCLPLAQALVLWLGPVAEIWTVRDGLGHAQHALVHVGNLFLDGDGATDEATLLRRWRDQEWLIAPYLTPFDPAEALAAGIFVAPELAVTVLAALRAWRDGPAFAVALTTWSSARG